MKFIHHPDGKIVIDGQVIPIDIFLARHPGYALPAGFNGREYDTDDEKHILYTGKSQAAGPFPWPEGDEYIANLASYVADLEAVKKPPPPPAQTADTVTRYFDRPVSAGPLEMIIDLYMMHMAANPGAASNLAWFPADPTPENIKAALIAHVLEINHPNNGG